MRPAGDASPRLTAVVPATNHPSTLSECLRAIEAAEDPPEEVVVVERAAAPGPAAARNEGAARASGDVLVFVDADVLPHRDAFRRIRAAFAADPELVAIFGSYDDHPAAPGVVSGFRNLLHHHVHQQAPGRADTFWAGIGAIRREAFAASGGFDAERFRRASIEDVELGARLAARGAYIRLDPGIQGTHLKSWTLLEMVRTDLLRRGVPWVVLLLRTRHAPTTLNLGWRHRLSATAACLCAGAGLGGRPVVAASAALGLVALNAPFYGLLVRRLGPAEAALGVGLHVVHHVTAAIAVPIGVAAYLAEARATPR